MLSVQSFLIATWRWGWFKRFSTSKSLLGARLKSAPIEGRQVACFRFPVCHHSCVVCTPNLNQKKGMTLGSLVLIHALKTCSACRLAQSVRICRFGRSRFKQEKNTSFVQDLAGLGLAAVAPLEIFRKISQNFSPAGVTSPFVARAMPTDATSVVPVSGR